MTVGQGLVIDTSVAIKWIIDEEGSDKADLLRGSDMVAPALLRIEAANVLRTIAARKALSNAHALELFLLLQTAPVTIVDADEILERRALKLALELRHPVYDCVYLALAERLDRKLITADRRFLRGLADTEHADRAIDLAALDQTSAT
ncbi:type II toxin-antitoxin system VapC family toxin [uncultured Jannaschia sp.]|uniref:type II toxin-antitoxin system VapC family toxin n=1 Tax=uncultured Jannaschia sp. TaxID=293347 RepID=UPI002606C57C|nr:type II toxin-antitoxin system VapC family toxin [uncultured Jannaschia sp.]